MTKRSSFCLEDPSPRFNNRSQNSLFCWFSPLLRYVFIYKAPDKSRTQPWWRLLWVPKSSHRRDCERPEIEFLLTLQALPRIFKVAQLLGDMISWDQHFALAVWSHRDSADWGSEAFGAALTEVLDKVTKAEPGSSSALHPLWNAKVHLLH